MPDDRPGDDFPEDAPTLDVRAGSAPAPAAPGAPAAPLREIGGYRILGKLGEGGMGIVYEAEQQNPRRRVALKVVRGGHFVDEIHVRMFRREAETLARLVHPNIAAIHEAGRTEDGRHFFTMELVTGRTLSEFVRERLGGERPSAAQLRERLRLFATICRAVNYAHQRGVIHRDLKPSNVIVSESGEVKILDFGLARITDSDVAAATVVSEVGTIKGTLPYMSPEQARGDGRDIDLRTDVYSLGVLLHELLAGRHPYDTTAGSVVQALRTICEATPPPLREAAGGLAVDTDLQTIVAKALEKEPDQRYQSAGALADDVDRFLANQPILAHPPSTMYQLRKLVSRHKGRVAALGAIGVLAVALLVTMVVQARRVQLERDRATAAAAKAEAINGFLLDALGGADPWSRGSRTVTLVDALHQAQAKAHAAFAGQPLVEASVLQTLGTTFGGLGEYAEADTALRASLALREQVAGRRSPEVEQSLVALVALYMRWERYPDGEAFAREAVDLARSLYEPTDLRLAVALGNLASVYSKEAKLTEAKAIAEQAVRIAHDQRAAGPDAEGNDPLQIESSAMSVLAEVALAQSDGKAMVEIDRDRLALLRGSSKGSRPEMAQALNDLATGYLMGGDYPHAESSYTQAIALAEPALGPDHPQVAAIRENLGNVYFREGRLDLTARNLEAVLAVRRRALGDDSEPVARTLANMATVYLKAGEFARAESTYREALPLLSRRLGPAHPDVGITTMGLGNALRREGRYAEAEAALHRALAILDKAYGDGNAMTQRALHGLVDLYTEWKKPAQAAVYAARLKPAG